jgi:hypothetical protein
VSRINSNTATTGGYKWFVTFWTDKGHLNPGDVPTFGIVSSLTDGTIAATASEDIRGNVLRGSFMVGATVVPWDATDVQMRDAVQVRCPPALCGRICVGPLRGCVEQLSLWAAFVHVLHI